VLGRVGSGGYRAGSDQQDVWTGQGGHWLSERGPRSSVLEISFSISLTVKSFKSLCDWGPGQSISKIPTVDIVVNKFTTLCP